MNAEYRHKGDNLDYVNPTETTIEAGTVIAIGKRAAITATRIAPGELGAVTTTGVFTVEKDASAFAMGDTVYYDAAADKATATEKDVVLGYCTADAIADSSVVSVKLNG